MPTNYLLIAVCSLFLTLAGCGDSPADQFRQRAEPGADDAGSEDVEPDGTDEDGAVPADAGDTGEEADGGDLASDTAVDGGDDPSEDLEGVDLDLNDEVYDASDVRPPETVTCLAPDRAPSGSRISLERVFESQLPDGGGWYLDVDEAPHEGGRWYAALHHGPVVTWVGDGEPSVALNVGDQLWRGHPEMGLLSLAFYPDFEAHPWVFLVYSTPYESGWGTRIARYDVNEDGSFDGESLFVILDVTQPHGSHSGNQVMFGPDGYLYHILGDGQNPEDLHRNGQNPNTLYATVLRLDVSGVDDVRGTNYRIPDDNPFVDGGGAPEVYAYGLRNPWRMSFDAETGDLWVGDVGQGSREEVNRIEAGANYGWPLKEGELCLEAESPCDDLEGVTDPMVSYTHGEGASVSIGYVYRGSDVPAIEGELIYADYISGAVWALDFDGPEVSSRLELETPHPIVGFVEDNDRELYAIDLFNGLYRIVAVEEDSESVFPMLLSQTGCVDPDDPSVGAGGMVPFLPIAALWSDGAGKDRYLSIPAERRIEVEADGDFIFPLGTVLMKHFGTDERLHETRLMILHEDGWGGYSYEWNDDETDAVLLDTGKSREVGGGLDWNFPSRSACMRCHTEAAGRALGPELIQLDHAIEYADVGEQNQLDYLFEHDYFAPEITSVEDLPGYDSPVMPDPFGEGPLEERARAYLHSNCSNCHRPEGPGRGELDMRFHTALADTRLCGLPLEGTLWLPDPDRLRVVAPGAPEDSVLMERIARQDGSRMPPLGTDLVDEQGTALIREWIEALESCDE